MAAFVFDGTSNVTAAKADTVVLTANPAAFTSAAELNGNVVLTFGSQTLTITGTTLAAGNLPNVSIPNGQFLYATTGAAGAAGGVSGNTLAFLLGAGTTTTLNNTSASGVSAAFGGLGRADSVDNAETISIAATGKGSYLVYGNAGGDSVSAGTLDSNTATTVFGGKGSDTINLGAQSATTSNFAIYGGEDGDSININHTGTGSLTIFGGTAAADSSDGADSINLGSGTAGTFTIYAGGGADIISSDGTAGGAAATLASGAVANIFGGDGNDTISIGGGAKATISIAGGAGADQITVANVAGGSTTIFGGTGTADSLDGNDSITVSGGGTFAIYGNAGADTIVAQNLTASADTNVTSLTIFGGRGDDSLNINVTGVQKANLAIYGSENGDNADTITAANAVGGSTIIYGGTAAADAADGKDSITVTGSGATTVYAAGGDDTVNLSGTNATADSTNVITVFGGAGNDSINLGTQVATTGGVTNGAITITAGAGADTIALTSTVGANASSGQNITITDFVTGTGGDKLALTTGAAGVAVVTANGASAQTLQQALDLAAANTTVSQVGVVAFQGNTYVVVDNNNGTTFDAATDVAIKLTGITDVAAVAAAITLA